MGSSLHYFVEGECEKAFLRSFMFVDGRHFRQGKIEVFNFINERLTKAKARTLNKDMSVAIIFDTDVENIDVLEDNIKLLRTVSMIDDEHIFLIPSIKNFEDELVYSCSKIKTIHDLFNTRSVSEFKKKFIAHHEIVSKLDDAGFNFNLIWSRNSKGAFKKYINKSSKIKN